MDGWLLQPAWSSSKQDVLADANSARGDFRTAALMPSIQLRSAWVLVSSSRDWRVLVLFR